MTNSDPFRRAAKRMAPDGGTLMRFTGELLDSLFGTKGLINPLDTPTSTEFKNNYNSSTSKQKSNHVGTSASEKVPRERYYRDKLARQLCGETEVPVEDGRIDVLTCQEIIEVKHIRQWKSALGQILHYGQYYPCHQKRIHLFGVDNEVKLPTIQHTCERRNVIVTWER